MSLESVLLLLLLVILLLLSAVRLRAGLRAGLRVRIRNHQLSRRQASFLAPGFMKSPLQRSSGSAVAGAISFASARAGRVIAKHVPARMAAATDVKWLAVFFRGRIV